MKRLVCFCVLLSLILVSCNTVPAANSVYTITDTDIRLSYGDTYVITVVENESEENVSNFDFLWSSNDDSVAVVSKNGVIKYVGEGFCEVTARSKDNLEVYSKVSVFSEYKISELSKENIIKFEENNETNDLYDSAVAFLQKYGKSIINVITGEAGIESILLKLALDGLAKDVYWYSTMKMDSQVIGGVVYEITDWTNSACAFNLSNIDTNKIFDATIHTFNANVAMGNMASVVEEIQAQLKYQLPNDGIFHLDLMDDAYEYRVVIVGDYSTCVVNSHYSNGILESIGKTIEDLKNMTFSDLENYIYTITSGEILGVDNLRICIEARAK